MMMDAVVVFAIFISGVAIGMWIAAYFMMKRV